MQRKWQQSVSPQQVIFQMDEADFNRLRDRVITLGDEAKAWRANPDHHIKRADAIVLNEDGYMTHSHNEKHIGKTWHQLKEEPSPWESGALRTSEVTQEDRRISVELCKILMQITPDIPVISEENTEQENQAIRAMECAKHQGPTYWQVDPIDGTSNFVDPKKNAYGILIGLVENGKPSFGMTYYPEYDIMTYTRAGKAFSYNPKTQVESPLTIKPAEKGAWPALERNMTTVRLSERAERLNQAGEGMKSEIHPMVNLTIMKADDKPDDLLVLSGQADIGTFKHGGYEWDIAGRQAIFEAAGGCMVHRDGGQVPQYGKRSDLFLDGMWIGHPTTLEQLEIKSPQREAGRT